MTYSSRPAGFQTPPHLHYADDEWFMPGENSDDSARIFSAQKAQAFIPGQLPGFNVPPPKMGSILVGSNSVVRSPRGHVHYFSTEKTVNDWFMFYVPSDSTPIQDPPAAKIAVQAAAIQDPEKLLAISSAYGVPSDWTGAMIDMKGKPKPEWLKIRGPVEVADPDLERLQKIIDAGEACYKP